MSAAVLVATSTAALAAALLLRGPVPASRAARPVGHLAPFAVVVVAVILAVGWSVLPTHAFVLAAILALALLAVVRADRRRRASRLAVARADEVLALCEAMASDLASGQPPLRCLERAAREWPEVAPVATAAEMGTDVPTALRALSLRPGAHQLRTVAAAWQVAQGTGAGLAVAIGRAADGIRAERRTARLVAAELASARATARMLAALPAGVLLLGAGVGGDPLGFLLGTGFGLGCLAVGLALSFAGMSWIQRIADGVLGR